MIYLSKGILPWKPGDEKSASVSHCGMLHKLTGTEAELWLDGQHKPNYTKNVGQEAALRALAEIGIVEYANEENDTAIFRLLTNCAICPVRVKTSPALLNRQERRACQWIKRAGLRLTMAELVLLNERGIKPIPALLGEYNRHALTETIYTTETIYDGILETLMEKSPARDNMVRAVLGLLQKKRIFLI